MTNGFTVTQQRMIDVLADGLPHHVDELHACLPDELGNRQNVQFHVSNIRKVIRPRGQDIVCEFRLRSQKWYRHVRLLHSANDGHV